MSAINSYKCVEHDIRKIIKLPHVVFWFYLEYYYRVVAREKCSLIFHHEVWDDFLYNA